MLSLENLQYDLPNSVNAIGKKFVKFIYLHNDWNRYTFIALLCIFSPHYILVIVFPVKLTWPLCEVHCKFAYLLIPAIKGRTIIVASGFFLLDLNRKDLLFEDQPDEEESTIKPYSPSTTYTPGESFIIMVKKRKTDCRYCF